MRSRKRHLPSPAKDDELEALASARESMPTELMPMLAQLGKPPLKDPAWMYEPKLDGYRIIAFVDHGKATLRSRGGEDMSAQFPQIVSELAKQASTAMILDGEIIALGLDGKPSFNALQNRAQLKRAREIAIADRRTPAIYFCFDLLHVGGINLRAEPYTHRRGFLERYLPSSAHVQLIHSAEDGGALYRASLAQGYEGIVAKRRAAAYEAGHRSSAWLKVKATRTAEFVIGGYTKGKGWRTQLGSLIVGYWQDERLRYAAHVGTGFDDRTIAMLRRRCDPLRTNRSPFAERPPRHGETVWLEPKVVAEVKFSEVTEGGRLRAPVFLRLRDDIDVKTIRGQEAAS